MDRIPTLTAILLLFPLISHAAQEPITPFDYLAQRSFDSSIIDTCSTTDGELHDGIIVLAQTAPTIWQPAIVNTVPPASYLNVTITLCKTKEIKQLPQSSIRPLKPLWLMNWQLQPPHTWTMQLAESYAASYSHCTPRIIAMIIPTTNRLSVFGDIHGSLTSLQTIINKMHVKHFIDNCLELEATHYLAPLGDYEDRGTEGIEIWHYLMLLKIINQRMIPLQGNHETFAMVKTHGFLKEWFTKMGQTPEQSLSLVKLLKSLLPALMVGFKYSEKPYYRFLLMVHGGIDAEMPLTTAMEAVIKRHQEHDTLPLCVATPLLPQATTNQNYAWNEFTADDRAGGLPQITESYRGPNIYEYNGSAAKKYIHAQCRNEPAQTSYRLDGIVCAHTHFPHGLGKLKEYEENCSSWDPVSREQDHTVTTGDVFTCNASPETCSDEQSYASGCFSTFTPGQDGNWHVTTY